MNQSRQNQRWYDNTDDAAFYGNLECLKWLHEHDFPWDKNTCKLAAEAGNLDCLIYAREHGCPWDKDTCTAATMKGHKDCLEYAHRNRCPCMHTIQEQIRKEIQH